MAWTSPLTAVDGIPFTAAQYNAYVRDNFLEQAPAKATEAGQYFVSADYNQINARKPVTATVTTAEATSSTAYTDLSTIGPSVTLDHGKTVLVFIAARMANSAGDNQCAAGFMSEGASAISVDDKWKIKLDGVPANQPSRVSAVRLIGDITGAPGTSTFTMKYRVGGGTGTFTNRTITVFPLS